jgi:hypothetical protein
MLFKQVVALLALAAGLVGVLACITGVYLVWRVGSRLEQANERFFVMFDQGLASAQDRVRGVQKRLGESQIGTSEIAHNVHNWSTSKAEQRAVLAAKIESRTEKLAEHLQMADQWMEAVTETIRGIENVLELGASIGVPVAPISLGNVIEELTSIQGKLNETEQSINGIREFAANRAGDPEEHRLSRVFGLLGSTELASRAIGTRLDNLVSRLSQIQSNARQLQARISTDILLTTIGGYLVFAWIAASQTALCLSGLKNFCQSRSAA